MRISREGSNNEHSVPSAWSELQNAISQLLVNRGKYTRKRNIADLLISEAIATIRTIGSSVEMPIREVFYRAALVLLMVLEQMADVAGTYGRPDIQITVSQGLVGLGTWKTRSSAIKETKLEEIPDFTIDPACLVPVEQKLFVES